MRDKLYCHLSTNFTFGILGCKMKAWSFPDTDSKNAIKHIDVMTILMLTINGKRCPCHSRNIKETYLSSHMFPCHISEIRRFLIVLSDCSREKRYFLSSLTDNWGMLVIRMEYRWTDRHLIQYVQLPSANFTKTVLKYQTWVCKFFTLFMQYGIYAFLFTA